MYPRLYIKFWIACIWARVRVYFFFIYSILILYLTDRRDDKVIESNKRFTTTSRLLLSPTPEEDYVEYSCQAKHKALQPDMPMRATVQLSVLCKYTTREIHAPSHAFWITPKRCITNYLHAVQVSNEQTINMTVANIHLNAQCIHSCVLHIPRKPIYPLLHLN